MFLKFSQITFFYFLLLSQVNGAESGGMPQLNPEFWFSQIFWLIITFGFMFVVLSKLVLPKISENLETRKAQISENIESAEKQRLESENKIKEYLLQVEDQELGLQLLNIFVNKVLRFIL